MIKLKNRFISVRQFLLSRELLFYKLVFLLVCIFILSILLDYGKVSVRPEYITFKTGQVCGFISNSLKNGTKLLPEDFLRGFEVLSFENGSPRVRFTSNLILLLNVKLRIWLWNYIPPHPSFSLTWIFSLILSPIFLYKLIYNMTFQRRSAWIGLSVYFLSIGFLSGVFWLFHPAKPMTNFLAIFCFYLASKIILFSRQQQRYRRKVFTASLLLPLSLFLKNTREKMEGIKLARHGIEAASRVESYTRKRDRYSNKILVTFTFLLVVLLLAFFTDETAWFLFFLIPVIFPGIFLIKGKKALFFIFYLSMAGAFLIFLTYIAPDFLKNFGFNNFDFWKWLPNPNTSNESGSFKLINVAIQGRNFLRHSLAFFHRNSPYYWYPFFAFLFYSIFLFFKLSGKLKFLFLRILLGLCLFLVCQTALLTKHRVVVPSAWYYGALFPIFFSLLVALLLSVRVKGLNILNKCVFLLIIFISASHSFHPWSDNPDLTFHKVLNAWNKRGNEKALADMETSYPPGTAWLFTELKYARPDQKQSPAWIDRAISAIGNINRTNNLLARKGVVLTADSRNHLSENVYSLVDDNPNTFWHISLKKIGRPHWVIVDFGKGVKKRVRSLAARPRHDFPSQFFRNTALSGSNDGKSWKPVAAIIQEEVPSNNNWRRWKFENKNSYRYYQLLISDGCFRGSKHRFFSMAELAMFE